MIRFPWPGPPLTSSSLSPPSKPKNWMRDLSEPNKIRPGFTFTQPGFLKFIDVHFAQPHVTNISIGFITLGLDNPKKNLPCFPRPSRPKQNLTLAYFPSVWFLKKM